MLSGDVYSCVSVDENNTTFRDITPPLKQLQSFRRFHVFSFPSTSDYIVQAENYVGARGLRTLCFYAPRTVDKRSRGTTLANDTRRRARGPRRVHGAAIQISSETK